MVIEVKTSESFSAGHLETSLPLWGLSPLLPPLEWAPPAVWISAPSGWRIGWGWRVLRWHLTSTETHTVSPKLTTHSSPAARVSSHLFHYVLQFQKHQEVQKYYIWCYLWNRISVQLTINSFFVNNYNFFHNILQL